MLMGQAPGRDLQVHKTGGLGLHKGDLGGLPRAAADWQWGRAESAGVLPAIGGVPPPGHRHDRARCSHKALDFHRGEHPGERLHRLHQDPKGVPVGAHGMRLSRIG